MASLDSVPKAVFASLSPVEQGGDVVAKEHLKIDPGNNHLIVF